MIPRRIAPDAEAHRFFRQDSVGILALRTFLFPQLCDPAVDTLDLLDRFLTLPADIVAGALGASRKGGQPDAFKVEAGENAVHLADNLDRGKVNAPIIVLVV